MTNLSLPPGLCPLGDIDGDLVSTNISWHLEFTDICFHRRVVRKSIARVLTVINQTQKENLRKFYKVSTGRELLWRGLGVRGRKGALPIFVPEFNQLSASRTDLSSISVNGSVLRVGFRCGHWLWTQPSRLCCVVAIGLFCCGSELEPWPLTVRVLSLSLFLSYLPSTCW